MKKVLFIVASAVFTNFTWAAESVTWNCEDQDKRTASLSYQIKDTAASKVSIEGVSVKYQKSDVSFETLNIKFNEVFDTPIAAKSFVEKEFGNVFSSIVYENVAKLPSSLKVPSKVVIFQAARSTLEIVNVVTTEDFHYSNCTSAK